MKRLLVVLVAAAVGVGLFLVARPVVRNQLASEEIRKLEQYHPHYLQHLAVAKGFLEDSPALSRFDVPGGVAYSQHALYPGPEARPQPLSEDPRGVLARLEGKVLFFPRSVRTTDQLVTQFMNERLIQGETGEGAFAAASIPAGKVLVTGQDASWECASVLVWCGYYFSSPTAGPTELPAGETPRPINELMQQTNFYRNRIEEADEIAVWAAAGAGVLAAIAVLVVGLRVTRKRGSAASATTAPPG